MAEKSILAYFNTPEKAQQALEQLKGLQLIDSAIDRFDGYAGDGADRILTTGDIPSLGAMTLSGTFGDRDAGILAATSVSASGYSSGGYDNRVSGNDILLTAIVEEADYDKAMSIVRQSGAL
ncbi:hypothetical protein [Cohnella sp.]|uniref:hypothetical protein n=1 Tax=Cohnella sp. TaxID=1883426 RepID=UPI00356909FA